jgi:secondary thiamine-phosphate synthase enzyme
VRVASASTEVRTPERAAVVNVTEEVRRALAGAAIRSGLAMVSVAHTTCCLSLNEDEPGLKEDLGRLARHLLDPAEPEGGFRHDRVDDNARAHLFASLVGHSVTLPVKDGGLLLGTWQAVLLVEADGPRTRRIEMTFIGD